MRLGIVRWDRCRSVGGGGGVARAVAATVALALVASLLAAAPAHADDNQVTLPGGGPTVTLGPNAVLRIDGRLRYWNDCADGYDDWGYPASDVYLVESGFSGGDLEDAGGTPSTIVAGGSAFIEQIIAITGPTGTLGEGTYSIVFDTCQDERFDPDEDTIFEDAVTVELPAELPPIDASIQAIKSGALADRTWWVGQLDRLEDMEGLMQLQGAVECVTGDVLACMELFEVIDTNPAMTSVMGKTKQLTANMVKMHGSVAADPPRPDITEPSSAVVGPGRAPVTSGAGAQWDGLSRLASAVEVELALREALLAAIERYQGAEAAGDAAAGVSQARTAALLAPVLADAALTTAAENEAYVAELTAAVPGLDALISDMRDTRSQLRLFGLTGPERQALDNMGLTSGEVADFLSEQTTQQRSLQPFLLDRLTTGATQFQARATTGAATLAIAAEDFEELVDDITGFDPASVPSVGLPGALAATVEVPLAIDATPSGGSTVTWDLDADGDFDDAAGASIDATFAEPGHQVVAAKATNDAGSVVAHALVAVSTAGGPPIITATSPATGIASGTVGGTSTFEATATDPDGDPLDHIWYLDGEEVPGTGDTLTLVPAAADRGGHTVSVVVTDGTPGHRARHAWPWNVADVDADGDGWADNPIADCDDADPDRHPGTWEQLYNGVDDDCDPSTPDEPLELRVGQLWGWGTSDGAWGTGSGVGSATPRYQGVDRVDQVAGNFVSGALLDDDGNVWSWGSWPVASSPTVTGPGQLHGTPVPVPGVGGSGQLGGVTQIDSAGGQFWIAARTAEGRIVTWGSQSGNGGVMGQGVPHADQVSFPTPGYVVVSDGAGGVVPLEGATQVSALYGSGFALLADGTAMEWGAPICNQPSLGDPPSTSRLDVAIPAPRFGSGIVQIEGSSLSLMLRYDDGTVGWCSDSSLRPIRLDLEDFGGRPAVDVAAGGNGASELVLTDDGTLWVSATNGNIGQVAPLTTEAPVNPDGFVRVILPEGAEVVSLDSNANGSVFALREDGTVLSWGPTTRSEDGQGLVVGGNAAVGQLAIPGFVRQVSSGGWNANAVVLREGADVWTWGNYGAGLGRPSTPRLYAPAANGVTNAVKLVSIEGATYALQADGAVVGWGAHPMRAFAGNGPAPVYGIGAQQGRLGGVTDLVAGENTVAALLSSGRVVSWGFGDPALGDGVDGVTGRNHPDYVVDGAGNPIEDVVRIWGGNDGGLAQQADGTVLQWGLRHCGGAHHVERQAAEPVHESWPDAVAQFSGAMHGFSNAVIRTPDGSVYSCGTVSGEHVPRSVPEFGPGGDAGPAIDVAARAHTLWVVTAGGELWGWFGGATATSGLDLPIQTWVRVPLPEGSAAPVDIEVLSLSYQHLRLADGTVLGLGGENSIRNILGLPVNEAGQAANVVEWTPVAIDGIVVGTSAGGEYANGAALVISNALVAATGYVPPPVDVTVSAVGASGAEGETVEAGVTLSAPAAIDLAVSWQFDAQTGTVVIPAGATSGAIPITLPADGVWGADHLLPVVLTGVDGGARILDESAEVAVADADPPPTLTLAPTTVDEGDAGKASAPVAIALSAPAAVDLQVDLTSGGGTATPGVDYAPLAVSVVILAGETAASAPATALGDREPEPDVTFVASGALHRLGDDEGVAAADAVVTVADDDPVEVRATGGEGQAGETIAVQIAAPDLPVDETIAVDWQTEDGTAVAGTDFVAASGSVVLEGPDPVAVPVQTLVPTGPVEAATRTVFVSVTTPEPASGRAVLPARPAAVRVTTEATPGQVPDPPTDVSAIGGDGDARVRWKAPLFTGGVDLVSYEIETHPGGATGTVPVPELSAVVEGLENGTDYTFRVRASNQFGWSDWSEPSNLARPHPSCPGAPFSDVGAAHPFCAEIKWMGDEGVSQGYPDGTYRPASPISRQQMAGFTHRLLNPAAPDLPACTVRPFTDVAVDNPLCPEIAWMKEQGITTGFADGSYRPAAPVTRQAMAVYLYRLDGAPLGDDVGCLVDEFVDVPVAHPFCGEIRWVVGIGVTEGYPDGRYGATAPATRQAMAAYIFRYNIHAALIP